MFSARKSRPRIIAILPYLLLGALLAAPMSVFAQGRGGMWTAQSTYNRLYDPTTLDSLSGTVARVDSFQARRGTQYGIHIVLDAGDERIPVHLGPAWFIRNQARALQVGDQVKVVGSRVRYNGESIILAAAIQRGDERLRLRNRNGFPAWQGWRRQGRFN